MRKLLALITLCALQLLPVATSAHAAFEGCPNSWIPSTQEISYGPSTYGVIPNTGVVAPKELVDAAKSLGRDIDVQVQPPEYSIDGQTWISLPPNDGMRSLAIALSGHKERISYIVSVANCPTDATLYYYRTFPNVSPLPVLDLHEWLADTNNLRSHRMDYMNFKDIASFENSFNDCVKSIEVNASTAGGGNLSRAIFQVVGQDYKSTSCGQIMNFDMTISIHDINCVHISGNYFTIGANQTCRVSVGWPDNGMCDGCTNPRINFATFDITGPSPSPKPVPSPKPSPSPTTSSGAMKPQSSVLSVNQVGNVLIITSSNPDLIPLINEKPAHFGVNLLKDGTSNLIVLEGAQIIFERSYIVDSPAPAPTPTPSPTPTPTHSPQMKTPKFSQSNEAVACKEVSIQAKNEVEIAQPTQVAKENLGTVVLRTNCGDIVIDTLNQNAPVTKTALAQLASHGYFDNTFCHRLVTEGIYILQCGDPSGLGSGSPKGWRTFGDENLPGSNSNNYPAGTVAMANSGPSTNGSQFFFTYADTTLPPKYSIWGKVVSGLNIIKYVASKGVQSGTSAPLVNIVINSVDMFYGSSPVLLTAPLPTPKAQGQVMKKQTATIKVQNWVCVKGKMQLKFSGKIANCPLGYKKK